MRVASILDTLLGSQLTDLCDTVLPPELRLQRRWSSPMSGRWVHPESALLVAAILGILLVVHTTRAIWNWTAVSTMI